MAMINSALADLDVTGANASTKALIQAIVNAYAAIVQSADGIANNDAENPLTTDYSKIGVSGVNTPEEAGLLGDVLDTASRNGVATNAVAVDTVGKIQALADAVQAVMDGTANRTQLESLGVTGATDAKMEAIREALRQASDTEQLNTLVGLQAVVSQALAVNSAPTFSDTAAIALTSISEDAAIPTGTAGQLLSALTGSNTDADANAGKGVAITAVDANVTLWFTTNNGTTWKKVITTGTAANNEVLVDFASKALVLSDTASTRFFVQGKPDANGSLSTALTYRAWDTTDSAVSGSAVTIGTTGGTSALSTGRRGSPSGASYSPVSIGSSTSSNRPPPRTH
jgi:hypothetical protein